MCEWVREIERKSEREKTKRKNEKRLVMKTTTTMTQTKIQQSERSHAIAPYRNRCVLALIQSIKLDIALCLHLPSVSVFVLILI